MGTLKIINGGQTGVDTGATLACVAKDFKALDIIYPKGFLREAAQQGRKDADGINRMVAKLGGNVYCLESDRYPERTREVLRRCQAVLIITNDLGGLTENKKGDGTALTYKRAHDEGKQVWVFQTVSDKARWKAEGHAVGYWLKSMLSNWKVDGRDGINLMVAGPRGGKWGEAELVAGEIFGHVIDEVVSK
jgi:putative molybdenum carrier protein